MPELTNDDRERLRAAFDRQLDVGLHHGAQLAVYLVDPDREIRFVTAVEVDSPDDLDLAPVLETVQSLRD
jgi:hypothetical protein